MHVICPVYVHEARARTLRHGDAQEPDVGTLQVGNGHARVAGNRSA